MRLWALLVILLILAADQASGSTYGFTGSWPRGFRVYCQENPEQCQIRIETPPVDYLEWESTLEDVNRSVNASIKYRSETLDHFDDGPEYGDCDDYALTKRNILLRRGFDASTLLFLYVHPHGMSEDHTVLVVRTDHGLKVMDNMGDEIYDFARMMADWAYMEGASNPKAWVSMN
jgi:predicted transglutaminase-like cysteine proteinase